MENKEKEMFDEMQAKQAKLAKKLLLIMFVIFGIIFAIIGIICVCLDGSVYKDMASTFLPTGVFFIILGIVLYFVIPTKYNYEKYKARAKKYGVPNIYELNSKILELEKRIEELENNKK